MPHGQRHLSQTASLQALMHTAVVPVCMLIYRRRSGCTSDEQEQCASDVRWVCCNAGTIWVLSSHQQPTAQVQQCLPSASLGQPPLSPKRIPRQPLAPLLGGRTPPSYPQEVPNPAQQMLERLHNEPRTVSLAALCQPTSVRGWRACLWWAVAFTEYGKTLAVL